MNDEQYELDQFEHEMKEARRPRVTGWEIGLYVFFWIYTCGIIYMPLSVAFGWWPW